LRVSYENPTQGDTLTRSCSEDTSQETSYHPTDTVKLEHIKTFINMKPFIDVLAESADNGCQEANDGCEPD